MRAHWKDPLTRGRGVETESRVGRAVGDGTGPCVPDTPTVGSPDTRCRRPGVLPSPGCGCGVVTCREDVPVTWTRLRVGVGVGLKDRFVGGVGWMSRSRSRSAVSVNRPSVGVSPSQDRGSRGQHGVPRNGLWGRDVDRRGRSQRTGDGDCRRVPVDGEDRRGVGGQDRGWDRGKV